MKFGIAMLNIFPDFTHPASGGQCPVKQRFSNLAFEVHFPAEFNSNHDQTF